MALALCAVVELALGLEVEESEAREPVVEALIVADAQLKTEAVIGEALVEWEDRSEGEERWAVPETRTLEDAQKVALALCAVEELELGLDVEESEAREPVVDALTVADAQPKAEAVTGETLAE